MLARLTDLGFTSIRASGSTAEIPSIIGGTTTNTLCSMIRSCTCSCGVICSPRLSTPIKWLTRALVARSRCEAFPLNSRKRVLQLNALRHWSSRQPLHLALQTSPSIPINLVELYTRGSMQMQGVRTPHHNAYDVCTHYPDLNHPLSCGHKGHRTHSGYEEVAAPPAPGDPALKASWAHPEESPSSFSHLRD